MKLFELELDNGSRLTFPHPLDASGTRRLTNVYGFTVREIAWCEENPGEEVMTQDGDRLILREY